ncbi:hypothetical protein A3A64_04980 [Candidatus Gottesmanbacteria bacterium RIFCSPLOWO2_01_FULL_48_11]|uniref:N-acetyltransferase domain-containing protein n=3 Tax=Candidatus Gottesmaniibacteriota TaxID=1752720 RepID=A0A0G1X0H7_9BACT|nr:MAG: hypothetical protein UY16_C0011G0023 [Candidatus Gottesmanbacteria bacterium GW2011_GWA2_47_9]KKU96073.1 MAG: hypothetical protein UY27_C0004G0003 [Candidatus Gottesmanbacteria bacterium GW2011_GWA1_48_13]OGG27850.1 MAG: hypothetical protein A3A64_04980 [Candidatus Gottesmanbacteria bacterium RIFCSPLOWO2_01_FULL_48_11]
MKLVVAKRALRQNEINCLVKELWRLPHVGFINKRLWQTFKHIYVATHDGNFVGVCVVFPLKQWTKLGPLVICQKYQGKGFGKALLTHVVQNMDQRNLFIGSSNPKVCNIAEDLGFKKETSFFCVPSEIQRYLLSYIFTRFSFQYLLDAMKKKLRSGHWKYYYFLKRNQ